MYNMLGIKIHMKLIIEPKKHIMFPPQAQETFSEGKKHKLKKILWFISLFYSFVSESPGRFIAHTIYKD